MRMAVVGLGIALFCLQLMVFGLLTDAISTRNCTENDFGLAIFPCDAKNRTRSYMFFMKRACNPLAPGAYFPHPRHDIPCDCPSGQGLTLTEKGDVVCKACEAGDYSVGGELIDDWRFWNSSRGIPGSNYRLTVYCADIVSGSPCTTWHPGGNNKYLVSGPFRNATGFLNCLQQKSMVMYRTFVNEDDQNLISFRYKVDGGPCPRSSKMCANGLHFYIDDKKVLHADVQFTWKVFMATLTKGTHTFRWIYQSSCKKYLTPSLDVAFIEHLALVGTIDPNTRCRHCPVGTFSKVNGSMECQKCSPGTFQNQTGMTKCNPCPDKTFSRQGDDHCEPLPECTDRDYTFVPMPVETCISDGSFYSRKQHYEVPMWPGMTVKACYGQKSIPSPTSTVKCACQPGYRLEEYESKVRCTRCQTGSSSLGNTTSCTKCPSGHAAIPGLYVHEWPHGALPFNMKTNCSGFNCDKGWVPGGAYVRTERIAGNFETYIELKDVEIQYFNAKIGFHCAVDCRINPGQPKLAKPDNCFMRFTVKMGDRLIHDRDCIRFGGDRYRNGTRMSHAYALRGPGKYTFRWLFHHGDQRDSSLYSYEGRVYKILIDGVRGGSAKSCVKCPLGTYVSRDGSLCMYCPKGTYKDSSLTECKPCPDGYFAAQTGSYRCTKCGANTKSNATRDGCDINKCQFSPQPGIQYDLRPLGNDGGAMTRVQTHFSGLSGWYRVFYYVNPCFLDHDNSSCVWRSRKLDVTGKFVGYRTTISRTMACKSWFFDQTHSFSLGNVLGYLPNKSDPAAGLTLVLTAGYNCHSRHKKRTVPARTHIDLICDVTAGIGVPTPVDNTTDVEEKACEFRIVWRSLYACPICRQGDFETIHTDCMNGYMNKTTITKRPCWDKFRYTPKTLSNAACKSISTTKRNTVLIVLLVLFTFVIITAVVIILVLCRRNQAYRVQLFSSGKTLAQLQNKDASDFQELISDDTY